MFSIGQIVYIISDKSDAIIPAMIVEKTNVVNLEGESVSWKLAVGKSGDKSKPQKIIDSNHVNGKIYPSLDDVEKIMQANMKKFLDKLLSDAQKRTRFWYGEQIKETSIKKIAEGPAPKKPVESSDEDLLSGIDDIPQEPRVLSVKERLKSMVIPEDDFGDDIPPVEVMTPGAKPVQPTHSPDTTVIRGPDGEEYQVRM